MRNCLLPIACLFVTACSDNNSNANRVSDDVPAPSLGLDASTDAARETAAERKTRLREKAKTDPAGADAEAIESMSRNETIATAINSAGYLCAKVTSAYPMGGNLNVECVEYRSGKGRVRYTIDPNAGTVEQR